MDGAQPVGSIAGSMTARPPSTFEFHVARAARKRYGFDEALFGLSGNVVFADYGAARRFAAQMNEQRDLVSDPSAAVRAGDINAMGLVDEVLHFVVGMYRQERNPQAMSGALAALEQRLSAPTLDQTLLAFVADFPNVSVYRGEESAVDWLNGTSQGTPNREIALEEAAHGLAGQRQPRVRPHGELFDDRNLEDGSAYIALVRGLESYFRTQPTFGPDNDDLITLLRRPAMEATGSLTEQLRWIRDRWGFVAERFGDRLVISLDVLSEEERAVWMRFNATQGGAQRDSAADDAAALHGFSTEFSTGEAEVERFSPDRDWMPRAGAAGQEHLRLARPALAQVRAAHHARLDQIPDEELDTLARWGFTGLWLIGLWERSRASQHDQAADAATPTRSPRPIRCIDYQIAADLGGDEAYRNLRDRAWQRGIRLASDMVPNHMGIDSRWVIEHPDWFISAGLQPLSRRTPSTAPTCPRTSASASSWRTTTTTRPTPPWSSSASTAGPASARYIYHGNDGTSMPWNDTAQLELPEPGGARGGDPDHPARGAPVPDHPLRRGHDAGQATHPAAVVPGAGQRRRHPLARRVRHDARPSSTRRCRNEFWREVVDRVAAEVPDTLLAGRGLLDDGRLLRSHAGHAPRLQQRLHEHAARRGQRQVPAGRSRTRSSSIRRSSSASSTS